MSRITLSILFAALVLSGCEQKSKTYDGVCAVPGALGAQFELDKRPVRVLGASLEIEAVDGRKILAALSNCVIIESVKAGS